MSSPPDDSGILEFADDPWWREILIMMAGIEAPTRDYVDVLVRSATAHAQSSLDACLGALDAAVANVWSSELVSLSTQYRLLRWWLDCGLAGLAPDDDDRLTLERLFRSSATIRSFTERMKPVKPPWLLQALLPTAVVPARPDLFTRTLSAIGAALHRQTDALASARRLVVHRTTVAIACRVAGARLDAATWAKLRALALTLVELGNPAEQVKLIRQLVPFDDDKEVSGALRKLYAADSHWVRAEVFRSLLRYRIPHIGFDRSTIRYLWDEFGDHGLPMTLEVYSAPIMRSFVKARALLLLVILAVSHVVSIVYLSGLVPWAVYQGTHLGALFGWKFVVRSELALSIYLGCAMANVAFDLLRVPGVRAWSGVTAVMLSTFTIWATADLNKRPAEAIVTETGGIKHPLVLYIVAAAVALLMVWRLLKFLYARSVDYMRLRELRKLRRELDAIVAQTGGAGMSSIMSLYERFASDAGKTLVIDFIRSRSEISADDLSLLTTLAEREPDQMLSDMLWKLVDEFEVRVARAHEVQRPDAGTYPQAS